MCLYTTTVTNKLILQCNQFEHEHDLPQQKLSKKRPVPLSDDVFQKIKNMVENNMKLRKIRQQVYNLNNGPKPTAAQVDILIISFQCTAFMVFFLKCLIIN